VWLKEPFQSFGSQTASLSGNWFKDVSNFSRVSKLPHRKGMDLSQYGHKLPGREMVLTHHQYNIYRMILGFMGNL
jgi:hypothetical protein